MAEQKTLVSSTVHVTDQATVGAKASPRRRLYEIDAIRAVTALGVVGVHTISATIILTHTDVGQLAQNAAVGALHFTREIFLAITAFVMVYSYINRPFSAKSFWRKRGLGVLLPYAIWSLFYEVVTKPPLPPWQWVGRAVSDILSGAASFQLYYILLTLEFYIILPWFLWLMTHAGKRPWLLLGVSFTIQIVALAVDYHVVQTGPFAATGLGSFINANQSRFVPLYQFYAVLGGVAALYLPQIRAFLLRYGGWSILGVALGLVWLWSTMLYQVKIEHKNLGYGISVFQPSMVIYATAVAALLYWLAYRWASQHMSRAPRGAGFWVLLSNASFGVYLIHAYILDQLMAYVVPNLPTFLPEPVNVALSWALVAGITVAICVILLYTPFLSRLIGHPCQLRRERGLGRWLLETQRAARRATQDLAHSVWAPRWRQATPSPSARTADHGKLLANGDEM
jgi:peptidoglycan/LPS O-acetylase OafA/YrhL